METPNTENYTLGKGILYFNKLNPDTGLYEGERDMGNAPSLSSSIDLEKLAHYSSRGGMSAKDKEVMKTATPKLSFTLDEVNKENMALLLLAGINEVEQTAGANDEEVVAHLGARVKLGMRKIGANRVLIGAVAGGPFEVGETISTGAGSGDKSAVVWGVADGALYVGEVTNGPFVDNDAIEGSESGATAEVSATSAFIAGHVGCADTTSTPTWYVYGTDFTVDTALKDDKIGRVLFIADGGIADASTVQIFYLYGAYTYYELRGLEETSIEGSMRFVSDNPEGEQMELEAWRVSLTPDGDTAFIGEEWSTMSFVGEVLKDETGHPDSPYMNIIMDED